MRFFILVALIFAGCSGCSGARKAGQAVDVPCEWHSPLFQGMQNTPPDGFNWWEALGDPCLNRLMEQASMSNPDLQLAALSGCAADYDSAWLTVSTEVASTYIELRGSQSKLELIVKHIQSQKESLKLTKDLTETGFVGTSDQKQAEVQLDDLSARKPQIETAIQKSLHHLSVLIGEAPGEMDCEFCERGPLPLLPHCMPIGDPSDMIQSRPDVIKAKRGLSCFSGCQGYYSYQKTVLGALEEAENAIASFYYAEERSQKLAKTVSASKDAYQTMTVLYHRGLKDYPQVLESNRSYLAAEDAYLQSRVDLLLSYVAIYKAIGSGCE